MITAYLYLNAALYLVFAIWCTVAMTTTSRNLGYEVLNASGRSEYLVIYGGLQLGLAVLFAALAANPAHHRFGLIVALGFYVPIVIYRGITIVMFKAQGMTLAVGALETVLLLVAAWLFFAGSR